MKRSLAALAALAIVCTGPARADVIELTDGTRLAGVEVTEETLDTVRFERAGSEATQPSEDVLRVRFARLPDSLDEAEGLQAGGDLEGALELLDEYVEENVPRIRVKTAWAPAFAAWRAIEIRREGGDDAGVIEGADGLIESFSDSRYVPLAYLAKAAAQARTGDAGGSEATLVALDELAGERGLKRWELAARLARLRASDRPGDELRPILQNLGASAAKYPTVRARAVVAEAETYLDASAGAPLKKAQELRASARPLLQRVVDDPSAGPGALAAAHTDLAECLYYEGAAAGDEDLLREAVLHSLRVPVSYRGEIDYLPKALFFAFRSFDVLKERSRKADMLAELEARFPDSSWTAEAKKHR